MDGHDTRRRGRHTCQRQTISSIPQVFPHTPLAVVVAVFFLIFIFLPLQLWTFFLANKLSTLLLSRWPPWVLFWEIIYATFSLCVYGFEMNK